MQFFNVNVSPFTQIFSLPCCLNDHCIQSRITKIKLQLFWFKIFSWFATFCERDLRFPKTSCAIFLFYFDLFECAFKDKREKQFVNYFEKFFVGFSCEYWSIFQFILSFRFTNIYPAPLWGDWLLDFFIHFWTWNI